MGTSKKPHQPSSHPWSLDEKTLAEIVVGSVGQVSDDLQQLTELQEKVDKLQCDNQGIRRLIQINLEVHAELTENSQKSMFTVPEGTSYLDCVVTSVRQRLVLYHFHRGLEDKLEFEDVLRDAQQELTAFLELIRDLDKAGVNTPKLVAAALVGVNVTSHRLFEAWLAKLDVVKKQATQFKKTVNSHRNRFSRFEELDDETRAVVEAEYEDILKKLGYVITPPHLKTWKQQYGAPGRKLRKNHKVWLPILKDLESQLEKTLEPARLWEERPGGGYSDKAIPHRAYQTINELLHYCYPSIWDLDAKTTASIKSRCQRASSPTP